LAYHIDMKWLYEAYRRTRKDGAVGVDGQRAEEYARDLEENLQSLLERFKAGSYRVPPVRRAYIPKGNSKMEKRPIGVPTVADRTAQMVVKTHVEPKVEPVFLDDSYGYRPGKSAIDAVGITRKRCWRYDWVLEFDIRGLFDNIDHDLLMRAIRKHKDCRWEILYIERWLKAPFRTEEGHHVERTAGTPQGGVISPLLSNLFLHYAFDVWMKRRYPQNPWVRYADDGLVHCRTKQEAEKLLQILKKRFEECKLELHPEKTRIVYCKDDDRRADHPNISFDFLGYTFRPRRAKNRYGKYFVSFLPAVSDKAIKSMRRVVHDWRMHLKPDKSIEDLSRMFNPIIRGWINYYGHFYKSRLHIVLRYINGCLVYWARRKYKRLNRHKRRAEYWLGRLARRDPRLFTHWQMGTLPTAG